MFMPYPITIPPIKPHQAIRFWGYVKRGKKHECWPYTMCKWSSGYGAFSLNDHVYHAHRIAWQLTHGTLSKNDLVLHHCDNPPCCNPDHLFLGDHDINQKDRKAKGRSGFGERNGRAKLTEAQVLEIRRRYVPFVHGPNSSCQMAKEFGVSECSIQYAIRRKSWKHI